MSIECYDMRCLWHSYHDEGCEGPFCHERECHFREEPEFVEIGKMVFPDQCPGDCPGKNEPFYQGNLCTRCPIFNCAGPEDIRPLRPEDYRHDWAVAWHAWFKNGMEGRPELYLAKKEEKE